MKKQLLGLLLIVISLLAACSNESSETVDLKKITQAHNNHYSKQQIPFILESEAELEELLSIDKKIDMLNFAAVAYQKQININQWWEDIHEEDLTDAHIFSTYRSNQGIYLSNEKIAYSNLDTRGFLYTSPSEMYNLLYKDVFMLEEAQNIWGEYSNYITENVDEIEFNPIDEMLKNVRLYTTELEKLAEQINSSKKFTMDWVEQLNGANQYMNKVLYYYAFLMDRQPKLKYSDRYEKFYKMLVNGDFKQLPKNVQKELVIYVFSDSYEEDMSASFGYYTNLASDFNYLNSELIHHANGQALENVTVFSEQEIIKILDYRKDLELLNIEFQQTLLTSELLSKSPEKIRIVSESLDEAKKLVKATNYKDNFVTDTFFIKIREFYNSKPILVEENKIYEELEALYPSLNTNK